MKLSVKLIFAIFFFLNLFSCKKEEPKPLIPDEQMIEVLVDLHIAEAAILSANKSQKDSVGGVYYQQIFEMNQISDSLFYKNLDIISNDPIKVEALYEKVIEKIEKLDLDSKKESKIEEEKPDTIGIKKK